MGRRDSRHFLPEFGQGILNTWTVPAASEMSTVQGSSSLHQRLVRGLVDYLKSKGWTVTHVAGIGGYQEPVKVGGRIPDVIANRSDGLIAVGEAETCEFLSNEQTLAQIRAFSDLFMTQDKREIPFFIVVPASCYGNLTGLINSKFTTRAGRITCLKLSEV